MTKNRRWLGVHIATIGALLSLLFGAVAMFFGSNPDGLFYNAFFWLGALSAPLVLVGLIVHVVVTYSEKEKS